MPKTNDPIPVRTVRLNNLIVGKSKAKGNLADALSREALLDLLSLFYNECDKEAIKKKDKQINEFVTKYRPIIEETKSLRVNPNDFNVKGQIGRGYFGNIHLVEEKSTGNIFAMKKIKKSVVTTSQVKEERDIMACRKSEWITNLHYAFQDPDNLYLIMEFLPGGDLLNLMSRHGPFNEDYTKFYLAELTQALNELHKMGFVHRDIKPENILIDRYGHIKLADFGNSACLDKDGHVLSMSPVGTPDYIAPELLQTISTYKLSKSLHGVTCDFWSMGIIGFELLFETTPFHEDNVHATYSKILSHCDDSTMKELIVFPSDVQISQNCRNLLESLITGPSRRLSYDKIINHKFFNNVKWDSLRKQDPPIIPSVSSEDDISNFEEIERSKSRRNTFLKKSLTSNMKSNEFCGKDLPFLGYSYVHIDESEMEALTAAGEDIRIERLLNKIKDLQKSIHQSTTEITTLQTALLKAEQKAQQMDSQSKILVDAKKELEKMKNILKEKTIELATAKTEIKTLRSSLKIEEEMRLKNEKKITETLAATYKKWEKTKSLSDQDYENKLTQKKNEITGVHQKLDVRENELATRVEECRHLQDKIESYKEMLKQIKDKALADKEQFEKNKSELIDTYEQKMIEIRQKLRLEKDSKCRLTMELSSVQSELRDSISSTTSGKEVNEKNVLELRARLGKEIERNNNLRKENTSIEKNCDYLKEENERLKQELQLIECTKKLESKNSDSAMSSPYRTAHGSLSDLQVIEEQLRSDLEIAKENEDQQRKRAEELEKLVEKLEAMLNKLGEQPKSVGDMLEKQNEKLEDKLASTREQLVVEKQSARTANLNLWKIEKQLEEVQQENQRTRRRMELTEEKIKKTQNEKEDIERSLADIQKTITQKDRQITELKSEILVLKRDVQKEHKLWEKAEQERMKEKSEVIDKMSAVHKLEEKISDLTQKLTQAQRKVESVSLENKRLQKEMQSEHEKAFTAGESVSDLQMKLKSLGVNYDRLKYACEITDSQLTEIEGMLENEQKQHKEKSEKLNKIYKTLREKDEQIMKLKNEGVRLSEEKAEAEMKANSVQIEVDDVRVALEETQKKMINQQQQLIEQSNSLFEVQEKIELYANDSNSMQIMNGNLFKEINILKEENTRILTDLYLSKEECLKTSTELKDAIQRIVDLKQENAHLNETLTEKKIYYAERDFKAQATLKQHQKLIDHLNLKLEDLSKKKKTLADKIFGTHNSNAKKENINPNIVESSVLYRSLQDEFKREQKRNQILQEKLDKLNKFQPTPIVSPQRSLIRSPSRISISSAEEAKSPEREILTSSHRFELTLDNNSKENITIIACIVCSKSITSGLAHWKCKECYSVTHRLCRSNLKENKCTGHQIQVTPTAPEPSEDFDFEEPLTDKRYSGELILKLEESFGINCAYEINDKIVLLGGSAGLTAFHIDTRNLVSISGLENIIYISTHPEFSKAIIIASGGETLYQCDLEHLKTKSKASACTKPKLDSMALELPFANRGSTEKWERVEMHYSQKTESCHAIAATTARIVILRFDWGEGKEKPRFKPVRALDTTVKVSSILFMDDFTAIVSSDKFFEIELKNYRAEEFTETLTHTRNYEPKAVFKISEQELLLCFMEGGLFVDQYGCESRPYEINWQFTPTGFMFRAPLLYVSHYNHVQVIRIHRSYTNDLRTQSFLKKFEGGAGGDAEDEDEPKMKRVLIDFEKPKFLTDCKKLEVYLKTTNKQTEGQEIYSVDGLMAFKRNTEYLSMETLSSEATCLTGSIDTLNN